MNSYEYTITSHPSKAFREVVYFCSNAGECDQQEVPFRQIEILQNILNEQGKKGWELVHVAFGKDGVLIFWKRVIT